MSQADAALRRLRDRDRGDGGPLPRRPRPRGFWRNLREGRESIRFFSREELERAGEEEARLDDSQYVPARPVLDGVGPLRRRLLRPQPARGRGPRSRSTASSSSAPGTRSRTPATTASGSPGPSASSRGRASATTSSTTSTRTGRSWRPSATSQATIHNVPDSLATLVGYKLNLRGACCAVQTFCSTSLVAVHTACQSLLGRECDMALAGGVTRLRAPGERLPLPGGQHRLPRRALPGVRRAGRGHRLRQRRRGRRPAPARGRARGRRRASTRSSAGRR